MCEDASLWGIYDIVCVMNCDKRNYDDNDNDVGDINTNPYANTKTGSACNNHNNTIANSNSFHQEYCCHHSFIITS